MFYGSKKYIYFDFKMCLAGRGYQKELQQRIQKHLEKAQWIRLALNLFIKAIAVPISTQVEQ